ncbi:MAG: hypothetical protein QW597_04580 [Thermoplasmataceae archaeon]
METQQDAQIYDFPDSSSFYGNVRLVFTVAGILAVFAAGAVMRQSALFSYILLGYAFGMIAILLRK